MLVEAGCPMLCAQALRTFQECLMALEGIMVAEGMKHEGGRVVGGSQLRLVGGWDERRNLGE